MIRNEAALEFFRTRRSRPAKLLREPGPNRPALIELLKIAARCPDHGKLEPFRFIVLQSNTLKRLGGLVREIAARDNISPDTLDKEASAYEQSPVAVVVVFAPKPSAKVPRIEQQHAAASACYGLLASALAAGWGANWLTGWPVYHREFVEQHLGLSPEEEVVGLIHIGSTETIPPERPRPDLSAIVEWASE